MRHKTMRYKVLIAALAACLSASVLVGCAGGACEFEIELIYSEYNYCKDGWTAQECAGPSDTTYHDGMSCEDLGYTKECPSSSGGPRMFQPGDSCR